MCGIVSFFASESVPRKEFFNILFEGAEERGQDGFGLTIWKKAVGFITYKTNKAYHHKREEILNFTMKHLALGDVLLAIARNAPETEELTGEDVTNLDETLQPIVFEDQEIALVHNGAISERSVEEYSGDLKMTKIDSEVILQAYLNNNRNLGLALESIYGGWSAVLFDAKHNRLYAASSFIPLAHGYARGLGLVYHSNADTIRSALAWWFHRKELQFTRIWEDFYVDEVPNYLIESTELDTGLIDGGPYMHKFIHPIWQQDEVKDKDLYLVSASGGIDSTTTMAILKDAGKNVIAIHFNYFQKSSEAEELSIKNICKKLDIPLQIITLHNYKTMKSSMLQNKDIEITTDKNIKSTAAWVPARNIMFLSVISAMAEEYILNNQYSKVYIAGGFPLISEESVYPDNGQRFVNSFEHMLETGSLAGANGLIKIVNPIGTFTKAEELSILKQLGLEELFGMTVSCDNAIVENGVVKQCWAGDYPNGSPACGSGRLSLWAAKKAGIKDNRVYYKIKDIAEYEPSYMNGNPKDLLKYAKKSLEK